MVQAELAAAAQEVDSRLARDLRAGLSGAFEGLCERFGPRLYRFAAARLPGDAHGAEEVMTLALVDAFRNIARYDSGRSTLAAWLFGIAARKLHDVVRRRRRLKSIPPFAQVSFDGLREAADGHDLSAEAASRLDAQRQAAALAEVLSDLEFAVLALSAIEELSAREIGQTVGRSERAVHSILHRARTKARERLTDDG